ncbi:O-antigen ligase family protein [Vibrio gallicus]|uniref:O-antigen ligase family protein n=1 Tax=Vibrio gallicus TaxID=190897 RepID=UPI0021C48C0F|nr:O-antigen ligase family protein [Vibrio gallicus]
MNTATANPLSLLTLLSIMLFSFNLYVLPDEPVLVYDSKRLLLCGLIVAGCVWVLIASSVRQRVVGRIAGINPVMQGLLAVFFSLAFAADLLGLFPDKALPLYFYYCGLLILTLLFSLEKPRYDTFKAFSGIIIFCFLSVFVGFTVSNFAGDGSSIFTILSYANPRFLNQVQVWLVIPALYIALISKHRISCVIPILNFALMFALDARGLAIASLGGIALWALIDNRHRKQILKLAISCILLGFVVSFVLLSPLPGYLAHGEFSRSLMDMRDDSSGRLALWRYSIQMSQFWGLGSDGFVCTSENFIRPHNSILQILLKWGMIPALCFVALCLILLKQVWVERSYRYRIIGLSLLSGLAYSLVSSVLDSPFSLLMASLFTGWFCGRNALQKTTDKYKWLHGMICLLALLSIVSIAYKVHIRVDNNFYIHQEQEIMRPQFWLGNNCPDK